MKKYLLIVLILISCNLFANDSVVKLHFNSGNASPYGMASTQVLIDNKKIPLLVDLGAAKYSIVLTPGALKKIHVHFTGTKTCSTSLSGKNCLKNFIIPSLKIGSMVFHDVSGELVRHIWGGPAPKKHLGAFRYGLIGLKFLSKFNILLDYSHSKMIFSKNPEVPEKYKNNKWTTIPFILHGGIMTSLSINHQKPMRFILDTGSVPSIININNNSGIHPENCHSYLPYHKNCKMIETNNFSFNSEKLKNTWFQLVSLPKNVPFDGLIGDNFFRKNVIYINFEDKKILIEQ